MRCRAHRQTPQRSHPSGSRVHAAESGVLACGLPPKRLDSPPPRREIPRQSALINVRTPLLQEHTVRGCPSERPALNYQGPVVVITSARPLTSEASVRSFSVYHSMRAPPADSDRRPDPIPPHGSLTACDYFQCIPQRARCAPGYPLARARFLLYLLFGPSDSAWPGQSSHRNGVKASRCLAAVSVQHIARCKEV